MSQAFVRESDDNGLLHQVKPTIPALVNYVKSENNRMPVFVKQITKVKGIEVILLSNGFSYLINDANNWEICL